MTFLESAFLAGLLAAAIPVAIHILNRRKARRLPFPTLRFLREASLRTACRNKLTEVLVLALRVAALVLLALALARPVLRTDALGGGRASRVVVIDNSMSMDARVDGAGALERCRLAARRILARAEAADRAAVVALHGTQGDRPALTESRRDVEAALAAVRATHRASPLREALERAFRLLEGETNPVREIYLLSDLQASAFGGAGPGGPEPLRAPEGVRLVLLRPSRASGVNVCATSCGATASAGSRTQLRARLRAFGAGETLARAVLSIDGKAVEERAARLQGGGEASLLFTLPELSPGPHRAEVRAEDGLLPADDAFEVLLEPREALRVLVARDAAAPGALDPAFYLAKALLLARERVSLKLARPNELAAGDLAGTDVVFLVEPSSLEAGPGAALAEWVLGGGGLFVSSGPAQSLQALDAFAARGERFAPVILSDAVRAAREPFRIATWDEGHPVWAPLLAASPPLRPDLPLFGAYRKSAPADGARLLARFSSGDPALVERRAGRGTALFFASTVSHEWTNLPVRFLFAPFVHSLLRRLAPREAEVETLPAGAPLVARREVSSGLAEVLIEEPGGRASRRVPAIEAAEAGGKGSQLAADAGALEAPGVYVVTERLRDREVRRVLSVRPAPEESDLEPLGEERVRELLPGARLVEFSTDRDAAGGALAATVGSELKVPLLTLLLLALLLEPLAANRAAYRRAP